MCANNMYSKHNNNAFVDGQLHYHNTYELLSAHTLILEIIIIYD